MVESRLPGALKTRRFFISGATPHRRRPLQRVLENKIRRAALHNPAFAAREARRKKKLRAIIESILARYIKTGVLNDAAYAEMKTAAFRRAGRSARALRPRLQNIGITPALADRALDLNEDEDEGDAELKAALALARRRKLGPFRKKDASPDQARKDLATLARAGFSFDIARQVLGKNAADAEMEAG